MKKKISRMYKKRHVLWLSSLTIFLAIVLGSYIFALAQSDIRVRPNTHFPNFDLGGKGKDEVGSIVGRSIEVYSQQPVTLRHGDTSHEFTLEELGISIDTNSTVESIFGDAGSGFVSFVTDYFQARLIGPVYNVDAFKFERAINTAFGSLETTPISSSLNIAKGKLEKTPSKEGVVINWTKLVFDIKQNMVTQSRDGIDVELLTEKPVVSDVGADEAYGQAQSMMQAKASLNYGYDKWQLAGQDFYDLLKFYPSGQSSFDFAEVDFGQQIVVKQVDFGQFKERELALAFDDEKVDAYLLGIANVINKPARDATLRFEGGKVVEFVSAQDGQALNFEETKRLFYKKILQSSDGSNKLATVDLPVKVTKAKIANREINDLGIRELIGSGVSYFAGSIPNRAHNINLGSSFINGTLLAPGEVFSFVGLVGPVSADQGFKSAYIIKSGRTVLDDGGGICQVSTTVFRAALNSGLPIVKRTAHAYRVSYYEQRGFKAGLDATIFSPSVDLQFKNDTSHHILVQTTVNSANSRLQVDIYGTGDGRTVELTEPVVSNIIPAPEAKYEDDPTLPKGTTKQVDYAAAGATSIFTRKVYKQGELMINDTFKSVFRPWQAVYLVGTAG